MSEDESPAVRHVPALTRGIASRTRTFAYTEEEEEEEEDGESSSLADFHIYH